MRAECLVRCGNCRLIQAQKGQQGALWQHNEAWLLQPHTGQREGSLGEDTLGQNSKQKGGIQRGDNKGWEGTPQQRLYPGERGNGYGEGRLPGDREKPNGQDFECQVQFRVSAVTCNQSSGNVRKSSIFQQFSLKKVRCKADSQRGMDGQPEERTVCHSSRVGSTGLHSLGGQTQERERQ